MKIDPESIKMACLYTSINVQEVAQGLGVTRARIYSVFANSSGRKSTIDRIASFMGISPEVFYLGTPENKKLRTIIAYQIIKEGYPEKNFSAEDLYSFINSTSDKEVEIDI